MKVIVNCMFLKCGSGTNQDGSAYYYGSFIDKESGNPFNLYFDDMNYLKTLNPYREYSVPCNFYLSSVVLQNGRTAKVWKIQVDKEKLR